MTPHRQTRRNIIRLLAGQPADEIFQAVLDVKFPRVEDVGRDLCGRGDETYPEAALLLDIDDDVSGLNLKERVLADVINMSDDVPSVDHTVHATIDNVESGHTLQSDKIRYKISSSLGMLNCNKKGKENIWRGEKILLHTIKQQNIVLCGVLGRSYGEG